MLSTIILPQSSEVDKTYSQQRAQVRERYEALDESARKNRAREVARLLGITEAQWVAASCDPVRSIRLEGTGVEIFREVGSLGRVMALTRNDVCVHERHGAYTDIRASGHIGLVLGPDIDLRVFFGLWSSVWAVEEGGRNSLQFFDKEGVAIHKIYCTAETNMGEYLRLVQSYAVDSIWPDVTPITPEVRADQVEDQEMFRHSWLAMEDTHDFFPLLRTFNVSRLGAVKSVGSDVAQRVEIASIDKMLRYAAADDMPIMCFVGNRGMIQIHTGPVKRIVERGGWLNVLDPTFNMHLDVRRLDQAWVVSKPTVDGWVTSLEAYDADGELIVQFFGERPARTPELVEWRALMASFCEEPLAP